MFLPSASADGPAGRLAPARFPVPVGAKRAPSRETVQQAAGTVSRTALSFSFRRSPANRRLRQLDDGPPSLSKISAPSFGVQRSMSALRAVGPVRYQALVDRRRASRRAVQRTEERDRQRDCRFGGQDPAVPVFDVLTRDRAPASAARLGERLGVLSAFLDEGCEDDSAISGERSERDKPGCDADMLLML